jgi:hypothetical protein
MKDLYFCTKHWIRILISITNSLFTNSIYKIMGGRKRDESNFQQIQNDAHISRNMENEVITHSLIDAIKYFHF